MPLSEPAAGSRPRLYYLDWLRVLAIFGVFLFHNARFYDAFGDWHVKNASISTGASILIAFMSQWIMPLFFLIAGAGTYYALRVRRPGQFVKERSLRLLVPLAFGMLTIVVPQAYFEAVSHGEQLGTGFFQLYLRYLKSLPELPWFHLWFLAYLFVFSLLTLPFFVARRGAGRSVVSRIAAVLDNPFVLVPVLVILIAAVDSLLYPAGFWGDRFSAGGWNVVAYVLFFICGYLIFANPRIMETVKKIRWAAFGIALAATVSLFAFFLNEAADPESHFRSGRFIVAQFVQALNSWCWLFAFLGFGIRFLNRSSRFLSHANEAVLPFYVLHQTVIIVIGFYVVQWDTGVGVKYLIISTTSFVAIVALYELLVRRLSVLRFLFGMKQMMKRPSQAAR